MIKKVQEALGLLIRVSPDKCESLRFYQFNVGNIEYFKSEFDCLDIRVRSLPHYDYLRKLQEGNEVDPSKVYKKYLNASWGGEGDYERKVVNFFHHLNLFKENGPSRKPILTCIDGVKGYLIVDGNHRFSMAAVLNRHINAKYIRYAEVIREYSGLKRFFTKKQVSLLAKLGVNSANVGWLGPFQDFFRLIGKEDLYGCSLVDLSDIPFLAESLHYRQSFSKVSSFMENRQVANIALRSVVLRGDYRSHSISCRFSLEDLSKELKEADAIISSFENFLKFEETFKQFCVSGKKLYLVGCEKGFSKDYLEFIDSCSTKLFELVYEFSFR